MYPLATSTTTTEPPPPTTLPPDQVLYPRTSDYHWDRFDKNATGTEIVGGWSLKPDGKAQGPLGFGNAIKFKTEECMYDTNWMKKDEELGLKYDPCMWNPMNCTEGVSFNVWEKMSFGDEVFEGGQGDKRYLMSTGGDFHEVQGRAWPGFAIYHQGLDIVAVVSTGEKLWVLKVSGQLYNNTWTQIGVRWMLPYLDNPLLAAEGNEGREKMGGLEMYINLEKVGHTIVPDSTARGSTQWTPEPRLTHNGNPKGRPVMMFGCHQNSELQKAGKFIGFAGTDESPALIDEVAIWKYRLPNSQLNYLYGGFSPDMDDVNEDQFSAMMQGVDVNDPGQALAASLVLEAMLLGPPSTLAPFPTRTIDPTIERTSTELSEDPVTTEDTPTNQTDAPPVETRPKILSRQSIMSGMLITDAAKDGQDPEFVQDRFSLARVASALLSTDPKNIKEWEDVEAYTAEEGATKTVRELENYMLAWVGSVNTSAERFDDPHWRTAYFDPNEDTMRYSTYGDDMVMNVDKIPLRPIRDAGEIRMKYPDYDGWEWSEAKILWNNVKDNFTVPTGMFENIEGCNDNPVTILTAVYNGLTYTAPKRKNPVNIHSRNVRIETKVISAKVKLNSDSMMGEMQNVDHCRPEKKYMKDNPIRLTFYHNEVSKAKRTLLWHNEDYWEGLEVRHCVWWNERFGINGAWDDHSCTLIATNDERTDCECYNFGNYAVLAELLEQPESLRPAQWIVIIKWVGIILGTILLCGFALVVVISVIVGEMFHQIRMWCCISYTIANILMLLTDTSMCADRHDNIGISMALIYFYQSAIIWNTCETHATFKGVTAGIIGGRSSIYHPFAWGIPLITIGFFMVFFGQLLGTHPTCFISWERPVIQTWFILNSICFLFTIIFTVITIFNVMKVQSHSRDTASYLKDQIKGMIATSIGMMLLWSFGTIGYFSYMKTNDMDVINMMPMFQVLNGWFGVFMFFFLGVWSKRFRLGVSNKAEEEKKRRESLRKYAEDPQEESPRTAETSPMTSRPTSPQGSLVEGEEEITPGSRPASSEPRPGSSTSQPPGSRPGSSTSQPPGSRPSSSTSQPPSEDPIPEEPEDTMADAE